MRYIADYDNGINSQIGELLDVIKEVDVDSESCNPIDDFIIKVTNFGIYILYEVDDLAEMTLITADPVDNTLTFKVINNGPNEGAYKLADKASPCEVLKMLLMGSKDFINANFYEGPFYDPKYLVKC